MRVYPGLWSEEGHRFCRSLISQQDHWFVGKKSRYDYEAPLQCFLDRIPDDGSPWNERAWTSAVMAWAITTMSDISTLPNPNGPKYAKEKEQIEAEKKRAEMRRTEDMEMTVKIGRLMLDQLELAMEQSCQRAPQYYALLYFRARFAVDCDFKDWNETPNEERWHLIKPGRRVYSALCALLQVYWAHIGAVITATAIASRLGWSEEYEHLLGCYATAVGEKRKEETLKSIPGDRVHSLIDQMEKQMAETDGVEVLGADSDFTNFIRYWRERISSVTGKGKGGEMISWDWARI